MSCTHNQHLHKNCGASPVFVFDPHYCGCGSDNGDHNSHACATKEDLEKLKEELFNRILEAQNANKPALFGFGLTANGELAVTKAEDGETLHIDDYRTVVVLPASTTFSLTDGDLSMHLPS